MNDIRIKNGLYAGAVIVLLGSIMHANDPRFFLNMSGFVGYLVFLFFMVRSAVQVRDSEGGVLPFASAFIAAFIPMTIGVFFSSFFNYAIHNWINPDIVIMIKEVAIESATYTLDKISEMFDMNMDRDKVLNLLEEEDYSLNLGKTILAWLLTTMMGCIPALIIAAFTKRGEG